MKWTKLSCRTFKDNQTRLQLFALAYSLANFLWRLALPKDSQQWLPTTLQEKSVKIGAKVVRQSVRLWKVASRFASMARILPLGA